MPRPPHVSDESLMAMAQKLANAGTLTIRALRDECMKTGAGCDYARAGRIARAAKEESAQCLGAISPVLSASSSLEDFHLPAALTNCLLEIARQSARCITDVRAQEESRLRTREAALDLELKQATAALESREAGLFAELEGATQEIQRLEAERGATLAHLDALKQALTESREREARVTEDGRRERDSVRQQLAEALEQRDAALRQFTDAELRNRELNTEVRHLHAAADQFRTEAMELREQLSAAVTRAHALGTEREVALSREQAARDRAAAAEAREERAMATTHQLLAAEGATRARNRRQEAPQ
jgi:chromosome segregation ATPase